MREFRLFSVLDDDGEQNMRVTGIHNTRGYEKVRQALSHQYDLSGMVPNLQVYSVDHTGDRTLTLRHYVDKRRPLADSTVEVLKHLHRLWGFKVQIESIDENGVGSISHRCPED